MTFEKWEEINDRIEAINTLADVIHVVDAIREASKNEDDYGDFMTAVAMQCYKLAGGRA